MLKKGKMMDKLKIEYVDINSIKPYKNNAKEHPQEQIEQIKNSIKQFNMIDPIGIWKDEIVEGHGRLIACKELGYKEVPIIRLDHLSDEERKAYTLAHNKLTMNSDFDLDILNNELDDILNIDMSDFGFELDLEDEEEKEIIEDEVPEVPEEPKAKLGDIYQLGNHRLMCGDSTKEEDVVKLMNGVKADMVFTDPPYNIAYSGIKDKRTIENDKMSDEDFVEFLEKSIMKCDTAYVCCSWQYEHLFKKAMTNIGMPPKAMIIWNKVNPAQHLDKYFKQHEIIFYYGKFGGEKTIRGDIWECKRQKNTVHPTMKPIELIAMALEDNKDKEIVYDGFGGSGSTLIACEQLDRKCYMMELDEHYVDVIIQRWENFTGEKAIKLN
jgi:site-specific DNA-methyltransferase (adenine-specific)